MTNNKLYTIFFTIFMLLTTNAYAECDGFYIAGRAGYAKYEVDDDRNGVDNSLSNYIIDKRRFIASGALGYRYKHFRAELEYIWRRKNSGYVANVVEGKFKSHSYMFAVYYDFFPYSWFTPYISAGLGLTKHKLSVNNTVVDANYKMRDNNFTWSLGAGISAKITNRWNVDLGYRYYDMGDIDMFNGDTSVTDQEVYLGLRYVL